MIRFRLRVLLILAVIPLGLFAWLGRGDGLQSTGADQGASPLDRPAVIVTQAPTELDLDQAGLVRVRAEAPAVPGDRIVLRTAGSYNAGYYKVSEGVLGADLTAELPVTGRSFLGSYNYWVVVPATGRYQEGRSATFPIAIVAPAAPDAPTCGGESPLKADGSSWVCTYDDEFDGDRLNRRFWVPQTTERSGVTTGTRARYACAYDGPETIAVTDGNLELSLVNLPKARKCGRNKLSKYAFGQVMHFQTYAQTYGKYEVRALIPDVRVPGSQQSFWLWPRKNTYGAWPASGEIDFAELYSSTPGLDKPFVHYLPGRTESGTNQNVTHANCPIRVGEYNTYGVEWEPGRLTFLLNDEVCFVDDYSSIAAAAHGKYSPFDKPFYLSLNQAMGTVGNLYDPDVVPERVTTRVDWVRVWR